MSPSYVPCDNSSCQCVTLLSRWMKFVFPPAQMWQSILFIKVYSLDLTSGLLYLRTFTGGTTFSMKKPRQDTSGRTWMGRYRIFFTLSKGQRVEWLIFGTTGLITVYLWLKCGCLKLLYLDEEEKFQECQYDWCHKWLQCLDWPQDLLCKVKCWTNYCLHVKKLVKQMLQAGGLEEVGWVSPDETDICSWDVTGCQYLCSDKGLSLPFNSWPIPS